MDTFKYLGGIINKYGTNESAIRIRLDTSTSALIIVQTILTRKKNWL